MRGLRRVLALVLGATAGLFAGRGLLVDHPPVTGHAYREDILPGLDAWSFWHWVTALGWLVGVALLASVRRARWFAAGWVLGVPVLLVFVLVYNWHTWGLWGESPTIP